MKFKEYLREMVGSGTGSGDVAPFARRLPIGTGKVVRRKFPDNDFNDRKEEVETIEKWSHQKFGD